MAYKDERVEELASQGVDRRFVKWAVNYLHSGGIDDQEVDVAAYYDSTLSPQENRKLFEKTFPVSDTDRAVQNYGGVRHGDAMNTRAYGARAEAVKQSEYEYYEQQSSKPWNPKYSQLPGSGKKIEKQKAEKTELDKVIDSTPAKEPNAVDKAKGRINELKNKYIDEPRKRAEAEKRYSTSEKRKQAQDKLAAIREERELKSAEKEISDYNKSNSVLAKFKGVAGMIRSAAESGSQRSGFRSAGYQNRFSTRNERLGMGESGVAKMLSGGLGGGGLNLLGAPQKQRAHYVTVVEHGIARRVRVPVQGEEQQGGIAQLMQNSQNSQGGNQQSGISALLIGNNRQGTSRFNQNQPSNLARLMSSPNKSRLSGLSLGGGRKSFPNLLGGNSKKRWRL